MYLAQFHMLGRGKNYSLESWKEEWEEKITQVEKMWQEKVAKGPQSPFDERIIQSFPYYLGLSENAIQYLVDAQLDTYVTKETGTTCHAKYPFTYHLADIVFDHPSRDIALWIKHHWQEQTEMQKFIFAYEQISPISAESWKLIYSSVKLSNISDRNELRK